MEEGKIMMKKRLYCLMAVCSLIVLSISTSYAQIVKKDFSISSEFSHVGPFDRIALSRVFLGDTLSLSLEFYGHPQIKFHRNIKLMVNGYPYFASQDSATRMFGGSLAVYDLSGIKADGNILSSVLSNAGKIELEIPLENLQTLTWALPEEILTEWKKLIAEEIHVHTLSRDQVSQLYVSILGRASEGEGNAYWCANQSDMVSAVNAMLVLDGVKEYFGKHFQDNKRFITFIYSQTLGKDADQDPDGIAYWTSLLDQGKSRGQVVTDLIKALTAPVFRGTPSQKRFYNRVEVSNYVAENISTLSKTMNTFALRNLIDNVDSNLYSVYLAKNSVDEYVAMAKKQEGGDDNGDDDLQGEKQPPAPSNLKVQKKDGTHVLTWDNPASGDLASIEIWASQGSQRKDDAQLVISIPVDKTTMSQQGTYTRTEFDTAKDQTYWIRSISSKRYHSVWCPPDNQGGYVVPAGKDKDN